MMLERAKRIEARKGRPGVYDYRAALERLHDAASDVAEEPAGPSAEQSRLLVDALLISSNVLNDGGSGS